MNPAGRRLAEVAIVLIAGLFAWVGISQGLQILDPVKRGLLLAAPGVVVALLAFPTFLPQWWARIAVASAVWGIAFYGATRLYYVAGGAAGACAVAGLMAGAVLLLVALRWAPREVSRNSWVLLASGLLWVVGAALIGHGVELNLEHPLLQRKPGNPFLLAGVLGWFLPFALIRLFRPLPTPRGERCAPGSVE